MIVLNHFKTLLAKYGLDEFIERLHEVEAIIWGSAAVHCFLEKPSWEPADLDILVDTEEQAAKLSSSLEAAGYDSGIKTTVRDVGLFGYEDNIRSAFAETIDSVVVHQQWRNGIVRMLPIETLGRIRRVVKIYIGRPAQALAVADLDICQSHIEFDQHGGVNLYNTIKGPAAKLLPSLFDLSMDDMRRIEKWKARDFIISGFE